MIQQNFGRGRPLTSEEVVHHMLECEGGSGRKDDNRLENLMLFATAAEHTAHHENLRRTEVTYV